MKFLDSRYPKLTQYIRVQIPKLAGMGTFANNLRTYGSLTSVQSHQALAWGSDPEVVVSNRYGFNANGFFDPSTPNKIFLSKFRADHFERGDIGAFDQNSRAQQVYVVGTTLLHELCHWGNHLNGVTYSGVEAGKDFEIALYGRDTGNQSAYP